MPHLSGGACIVPESRLKHHDVFLPVARLVVNQLDDSALLVVMAIEADADNKQDEVDGKDGGNEGKCHRVLVQAENQRKYIILMTQLFNFM